MTERHATMPTQSMEGSSSPRSILGQFNDIRGTRTNMRTHQPRRSRPAGSFAPRQKPWSQNNRPQHRGTENAQQNYERYIALAQAEARAGNSIAAENYYQHAEHYFRSMQPDSAT